MQRVFSLSQSVLGDGANALFAIVAGYISSNVKEVDSFFASFTEFCIAVYVFFLALSAGLRVIKSIREREKEQGDNGGRRDEQKEQ